MKTLLTKLRNTIIIGAFALMANVSGAATYTAVMSGDWSNGATWGGVGPGSTVALDEIIIPTGITVNLDQDITISGLVGSLEVNGVLSSNNGSGMSISFGSLSGVGAINVARMEINNLSTMSFTGTIVVEDFINDSFGVGISSNLEINDSLWMRSGSLILNAGSELKILTNSTIVIEDGVIDMNGGTFTYGAYDVYYIGSSKTTGVEFTGSGLTDVTVELASDTEILTLGDNLVARGKLEHRAGIIALNNHHFTIEGDYEYMGAATIQSSMMSDVRFRTANSPTSGINFATGANSVNNLEVNLTNGGTVEVVSDVTVHGAVKIINGNLSTMNNANLTMAANSKLEIGNGQLITTNGAFTGTLSYDVEYTGNSKNAGVELSGSGLDDVSINLNSSSAAVTMNTDAKVNGNLMLGTGMLNLNGNDLEIAGSFSNGANASIGGHAASDVRITSATTGTGSLRFATGMQSINNFMISITDSSAIGLETDLTVNHLILNSGGVKIKNNNLTIVTNGAISGTSRRNYVMIDGSGSLVMTAKTSAEYILLPVGTPTSYSPARIKQNAGADAQYRVNVINQVYANGTSGSDISQNQRVVQRTWNVTSSAGSSVDMDMRLEWVASSEASTFNRNIAFISHYTGGSWDVKAHTSAIATAQGTYQLTRTGITTLSPFAVFTGTGTDIKEHLALAEIDVYPNPVVTELNCVLADDKPAIINIHDVAGKLIYTKKVTPAHAGEKETIDFSGFPAGVYFIEINGESTHVVKRIIKS